MFGRGICEKYQSGDEKFPEPNGNEIYSQDWYSSQIPLPSMIYLFKLQRILFRTLAK
jgi:hypothetical protein